MLYDFLRKIVPGVSWKNPVIALCLNLLDPIDWAVRYWRGLQHLPSLSLRVRSNGLRGQFGGTKFSALGALFARELERLADVRSDSAVLEIGSGVGRNAFGLLSTLGKTDYTGVDIDWPSVRGAQGNKFLKAQGCEFQFIDVRNEEYNPQGEVSASEFNFSFANQQFDVIFLVSVVTHILPPDLENYIEEVSRMLKPNGRLVFTTFLMDDAAEFDGRAFPFGTHQWRSTHEDLPEICVGYYLTYLDDVLTRNHFERLIEPVMSGKRAGLLQSNVTLFDQDIVVAVRK